MDDPTTGAMGHVALNLSLAMFAVLIDKGVIAPAMAHDIIDQLLTGLETASADDATNHAARQIVETLGATLPPRPGR